MNLKARKEKKAAEAADQAAFENAADGQEEEEEEGNGEGPTAIKKKGGKGRTRMKGGQSVRDRKPGGKTSVAKLRSQTEKPGSKQAAGAGGGTLARSKSARGTDLVGGGSSPGAGAKKKKKTSGAGVKKAAKKAPGEKKREKDVAKSVGGAREARF